MCAAAVGREGKGGLSLVFPRFERAGTLADLVGVLRRQHLAGRAMTAAILGMTAPAAAKADQSAALTEKLTQFTPQL